MKPLLEHKVDGSFPVPDDDLRGSIAADDVQKSCKHHLGHSLPFLGPVEWSSELFLDSLSRNFNLHDARNDSFNADRPYHIFDSQFDAENSPSELHALEFRPVAMKVIKTFKRGVNMTAMRREICLYAKARFNLSQYKHVCNSIFANVAEKCFTISATMRQTKCRNLSLTCLLCQKFKFSPVLGIFCQYKHNTE